MKKRFCVLVLWNNNVKSTLWELVPFATLETAQQYNEHCKRDYTVNSSKLLVELGE